MSLVPNYGSSSSESEDSDNETRIQQPKRGLSSMLPPPKKTVSIALPKLDDDDDDDEEFNRQQKRARTTAGLGLADLLPAPKNYKPVSVTKTTTDKAFIPHALAKKLKGKEKAATSEEEVTKPEAAENKQEESEDEDDKDDNEKEEEEEEEEKETPKKFTGSFFHIGKDLKEKELDITTTPKPVLPTPGPVASVERPPAQEEPQMAAVDMYAYDPNAMYSADPATYYQYQYNQQAYEEAAHVSELNDPELERLIGKRVRGEGNIQIKSVNQSDMLPSDEWRQQQAMTAAPKFNSGAVMQASKLQMKKNNIMALAANAVNNQEKMDEMFAANKKTRREAAKKYGF